MMFPNNTFNIEFVRNKQNMKLDYSLNLQKILLPKVRNIIIAVFVLFLLGTPPVRSFVTSYDWLTIIYFPFILFLSIFASNWFVQILDIIFLWVKFINFETKTIGKSIKYDDFYLLEYNYQWSERIKNKVFALLIITTGKKAKFKIVFTDENLLDAPDECKELIKYCQEQEKYMFLGNRRFPNRRKIIIGKKRYVNWSFYQRIFVSYILWILSALFFCWLSFYLVLRK